MIVKLHPDQNSPVNSPPFQLCLLHNWPDQTKEAFPLTTALWQISVREKLALLQFASPGEGGLCVTIMMDLFICSGWDKALDCGHGYAPLSCPTGFLPVHRVEIFQHSLLNCILHGIMHQMHQIRTWVYYTNVPIFFKNFGPKWCHPAHSHHPVWPHLSQHPSDASIL